MEVNGDTVWEIFNEFSVSPFASIVDGSPRSTLGALCVAAVHGPDAARDFVSQADDLGVLDGGDRGAHLSAVRRYVCPSVIPHPLIVSP
jgi:hypothetical protein